MSTVWTGVAGVVGRILLCWAFVAVLALFVVIVVVIAVYVSNGAYHPLEPMSFAPLGLLLVVLIGAVNVPIIWGLGDGLFVAVFGASRRYWRYALALLFGALGALSLYVEFRYEFWTMARFGWLTSLLHRGIESSLSSLSQAERFSQGQAFGLLFVWIANMVAVVSAVAPVLVVRHRNVQAVTSGSAA